MTGYIFACREGLVSALAEGKLTPTVVVKTLLGSAEVVATQTTPTTSSNDPSATALEDTREAYLSIYVAGLASISGWLVTSSGSAYGGGEQKQGEGGSSTTMDHHHPLDSALSLNPPLLARPVFQHLTLLFSRLDSSPQQLPATLICPIATSIIYQPECKPPFAMPFLTQTWF